MCLFFFFLVGLLIWNKIQGIWLIHSVPGFPPFPKDGYDYPSSGRRYGQNGICVTFKYSQYKEIGNPGAYVKGQCVDEGSGSHINKGAASSINLFIDLLGSRFSSCLCWVKP